MYLNCCFTVLNGKVMRKVGVEVVGLGALKLTGFLREQMQENNMSFESMYTVCMLKEVLFLLVLLDFRGTSNVFLSTVP